MKNIFCEKDNLTNEASVESIFINKILEYLMFNESDVKYKTSLKEFRIGKGSKSDYYKPDYVLLIQGFPTIVIDAKSPTEDINNWTLQCSSYCLEINKSFDHNPVKYYIISNGLNTSLFRWDKQKPILEMDFSDFKENNAKFEELSSYINKTNLEKLIEKEQTAILSADFEFKKISLTELGNIFQDIHQYIWTEEKKTPSAAFMELLKIIFIKIQKDKELHQRLNGVKTPKVEDIVFSKNWIKRQTEHQSPIDNPLFRNLIRTLEIEIRQKNKKRFFDNDSEINLSPRTIEKIVEKLEHIDLYGIDDDVHGRMFESFLDATIRGQELGQYFTPRDIVKLMVELANPEVSKTNISSILDACCGSGGFLITAMAYMLKKMNNLVGLTNYDKKQIEESVRLEKIFGIDAGSDPAIYRIARMNMYLHGDGGSNIYFADSLDKNIGQIGKYDIEYDEEISELRQILIEDKKKFDIILSNPPFSLKYSKDNKDQKEIIDQYDLSFNVKTKKSLNTILSSVMFLERYKDLISENGKIFAIIDDSILSGDAYEYVRDYIRDNFIILGIVSLPGDAFRRAAARVKTSILILRLKKLDEEQSDVFMTKSTYLGLNEKTAKRLGIKSSELQDGKENEFRSIIKEYKDFLNGVNGNYVVPSALINNRLDVKYCIKDNGRKKDLWINKGLSVNKIRNLLKPAIGRSVQVKHDEEYKLLQVNYDGEVSEGETKAGYDCSYSNLYKVKEWDILYSNMGVGRGAIGLVPPYHENKYVSNEYTILKANSKEEAVFYIMLLRSKEILGDILSSTTGMNRGRIKWNNLAEVEVPVYDVNKFNLQDNVKAIEALWKSYEKYDEFNKKRNEFISDELDLNGKDARDRWLAIKPPE